MSEALVCDTVGPSVVDLAVLLAALGCPSPATDDRGRIDRIAMLERVKSAAAAAQAREAVAFKTSQLAAQRAAGTPARDVGKGIGAQLALARRESPSQGARLVGLADALVHELPHTMAALTAGEVSEWRATLVARETACLSVEDRATVDARLAARLGTLSTGQVVAETRRHAYQLDPAAFTARSSRAANDRRVTIRPAPDTMTLLTALLPVAQGVAAYAALCRHADAARAAGDPRSRGQLMADTLVERVTGQTDAAQVPVEIQLIITDQTLFGGDPTPARITGHGPIPAPYARRLLQDLDPDTDTWIRRLYTDPATGRLAGIDTHRRCFTGALRRQLIARDHICRTPWCGAPIRHIDHPFPTAAGGATSEANGQGLCEACNYTKEAPGWISRPAPDGAGHQVTTTTPTGHTYTSRPPPLPGAPPDNADVASAPDHASLAATGSWRSAVSETRATRRARGRSGLPDELGDVSGLPRDIRDRGTQHEAGPQAMQPGQGTSQCCSGSGRAGTPPPERIRRLAGRPTLSLGFMPVDAGCDGGPDVHPALVQEGERVCP